MGMGEAQFPPHAFPEAALKRFCVLAICLIARLSGILTRRSFVVTEQSETRAEGVPIRWLVKIPDIRVARCAMLLPGTREEIAPPPTGIPAMDWTGMR